MRSLLMVGALGVVVMMFTGCCSDCKSGRLLGSRQATVISSDCGCSECSGDFAATEAGFCDGSASCRLAQTRQASLQNRLARSENRSEVRAVGGGVLGRLATRRQVSESFVESEIQPVGGDVFDQGVVAHAGGAIGCGAGGCGARGKHCRSCRGGRLAGRGGRLHGAGGILGGAHTKPYGGTIPHTAAPPTFNGGPGGGGVPQYVYPYYTTRGPRDFLNTNPPSIGP